MKKLILVLVSVGMVVVMFMLSNYRFTPESAALSNPALTDDFEYVDQHGLGEAEVLLFKSDEKEEYMTVLAEKSGLLYRSNSSTYTPYTSDPLQLVGGMSLATEENALTYLSVISNDDKVAYIEAGVEPHVERRGVSVGERVSLLFPFSENINKLNATAFDQNGKKLYYLGYPKGTNMFRQEDFRWHKYE
ncbi:hypothetical protein [Rossellomorea aquimaris]|uniref:hypothetical protein n=1 Tax=Rossellomorea aquimaris TaxID=189382 RepID=UPI0005CB03F9|nr:hypothetical protein [Rossellomorea aquimaris]